MKNEVIKQLKEVLSALGVDAKTVGDFEGAAGGTLDSIKLDYPENPEHGDFTTNAAMVYAKKLGLAPKALAEKIVAGFTAKMPEGLESVSVAGPGFVNFKVKDEVIAREVLHFSWLKSAGSSDADGGNKAEKNQGAPILVEYTDPNTFKVFHIGHLMANAIGESLSRLIESSGAKVIRICYASDIGLHIAKAIWAIQCHLDLVPKDSAPIQEKTAFLGKMYVEGTIAYEKTPAIGDNNGSSAKNDIDALNKVLYKKSSPEANVLYEKGRRWSIEHFNELYEKLGTDFDDVIYESQMASIGLEIVGKFLKKGIFEESQGATVFKGEDHGLHTRVFVSSQGIPTYEAKDLGLNVTKFEKYPEARQSIIVTASEQNDYFKVLLKVLLLIDEKNGSKTMHIGHGMMRFASSKMSSRTGNVVTAESLIGDLKQMVMERIADRKFNPTESEEISMIVAIGAIKYSILRSSIGSDIVFDSASSISFEGDSGPYLQYSAVRAQSILEKAGVVGGFSSPAGATAGSNPRTIETPTTPAFKIPNTIGLLEKLIVRFADVAERARLEYAPQIVANYLINLAGAFNSFYASQTIIDEKDPLSPYRLELTRVFQKVMTEGLWLLGIKVPRKM
jgi:arginyl-tRNA synthetase